MPSEAAAIRVLEDPHSLALPLSIAVDTLTGGQHLAWELETTILFLAGKGSLPDVDSREKVLAVIAVRKNPSYLWDVGVFKNVCAVLNDRPARPDIMDPCSPAEAAWTVVELERIHKRYSGGTAPEYGDEPCSYIAGSCAHEGLVVLPAELAFAEQHLKMFPSAADSSLEEKVRSRIKADKSQEVDTDDPVEIHASKLFEIEAYVWHRTLEMDKQLSLLDATGR